MDISGISSTAVTRASSAKTGEAVSIAVLNKALDIESKTAKDIVNSVASPPDEVPREKLAPHLGGNVDLRA